MVSSTAILPPWAGKRKSTEAGMTASTQDSDLVRRMASGDESAVSELYALYGQRLYSFALRLTNDPDCAQDVTQESLVIAWRSAGRFRGEGRLIAWLLGIVHHTAMKSLRHGARPLEALEDALADRKPSPEDQVQDADMKRWVRQGLQDLSPEHRAVLELVFYQGLDLGEVSKVMGCPLGTVKSRLSYARKHLRGVLSRSRESW
jgi:RNA polymerase sigma-70 factor (ECF subfamily)